jgi:hypothetical protein
MKICADHPDSEILNLMVVKTKEMKMIVSVGSNNVIQLHEDDHLTLTSVRRSIQIVNYEIVTAKLY